MDTTFSTRLFRRDFFILIIFSLFFFVDNIYAEEVYLIDPAASEFQCLIRYTVIGKYTPRFPGSKGVIIFDPDRVDKSFVHIIIDTQSIESSHKHLDRIARSARLLDVAQHPQAVFRSKEIQKKDAHYQVTGYFTFHGVTKEMSFLFQLQQEIDQAGKKRLSASGEWILNRKDFDITWHPWLDYGGLIVGNKVVLDWQIITLPVQKSNRADVEMFIKN